MTDKNVTPATEADDELRERWNAAQARMRDVAARLKPVLGDVALNDLSDATNEMIAVTMQLRQRIDAEAKENEELRTEQQVAIDYLLRATAMGKPPSTAPSKLIAMAALAAQHAKDIHDGMHEAVAELAKALTRAEDAEKQVAELRAVAGPPMPCGCYATEVHHVDHRPWWHCAKHNLIAQPYSPEHLAWRESKQKGG